MMYLQGGCEASSANSSPGSLQTCRFRFSDIARLKCATLSRGRVVLKLSTLVVCDFLTPAINLAESCTAWYSVQHNVESVIWERSWTRRRTR